MATNILNSLGEHPLNWLIMLAITICMVASQGLKIIESGKTTYNRRASKLYRIGILLFIAMALAELAGLIGRIPFETKLYGFCTLLFGATELYVMMRNTSRARVEFYVYSVLAILGGMALILINL